MYIFVENGMCIILRLTFESRMFHYKLLDGFWKIRNSLHLLFSCGSNII